MSVQSTNKNSSLKLENINDFFKIAVEEARNEELVKDKNAFLIVEKAIKTKFGKVLPENQTIVVTKRKTEIIDVTDENTINKKTKKGSKDKIEPSSYFQFKEIEQKKAELNTEELIQEAFKNLEDINMYPVRARYYIKLCDALHDTISEKSLPKVLTDTIAYFSCCDNLGVLKDMDKKKLYNSAMRALSGYNAQNLIDNKAANATLARYSFANKIYQKFIF